MILEEFKKTWLELQKVQKGSTRCCYTVRRGPELTGSCILKLRILFFILKAIGFKQEYQSRILWEFFACFTLIALWQTDWKRTGVDRVYHNRTELAETTVTRTGAAETERIRWMKKCVRNALNLGDTMNVEGEEQECMKDTPGFWLWN